MNDSNSWPGHISQSAGGVARNIAEALALLGQSVQFAGRYGDDVAGEMIAQSLTQAGVSITLSEQVQGKTSDSYLTLFDAAGSWRGAVADMALVQGITPEWLADIIPLAPDKAALIFDTNLSSQSLAYLSRLADERFLACDGVSPAKIAKLRPHLAALSCVKVTRDEAETLLQLAAGTAITDMISRLHEAGIQYVILSDGAAGFHLSDGTDYVDMIPPPLDVVSSSGAGDCLFAGILWGLSCGDSLATIAQKGQICATASLLSKDAVPADLSQAALQGVSL